MIPNFVKNFLFACLDGADYNDITACSDAFYCVVTELTAFYLSSFHTYHNLQGWPISGGSVGPPLVTAMINTAHPLHNVDCIKI